MHSNGDIAGDLGWPRNLT